MAGDMKLRKAPAERAADHKGKIMKGADNRMWHSKRLSNGKYRWVHHKRSPSPAKKASPEKKASPAKKTKKASPGKKAVSPGRKAPADAAPLHKRKTMKGADGKMWHSKQMSNGNWRWVHVQKKSPAVKKMSSTPKKKAVASPGRKAPVSAAVDHKGKTMRGKDGKMWHSKRASNGVYRWVHVKMSPKKKASPTSKK